LEPGSLGIDAQVTSGLVSRKRKSRNRPRPQRAAAPREGVPAESATAPAEAAPARGGYARSRAKTEAARAALRPLAPGERPTAVTVGAVTAVMLALGNLIAMIAGWNGLGGDTDEGRAAAFTLLWSGILLFVAWGMWRTRYWAVLGMQTLLGITLVLSSLSLISASSVASVAILVAILAAAGALFWFMVKAMARIQMPERPTRAR
jgi:hypothetical protein